jgi:coproporphyrinogen III oxidase
LHPRNPYVPSVHLIYRYFEAGPVWWFGGGADLTPYYPFLEDAQHFHRTLKGACDSVNPAYYPVFKTWCDEYFFLKHRGETRGVGGIFYDYQDPAGTLYKGQDPGGPAAAVSTQTGAIAQNWEQLFALAGACGNAFLPSYVPIVEKRHDLAYSDRERQFQLYRRGRYVEFNLVFDRGTIFGLQTNGRTESILMSLPPLVRWEYGYSAEPGSREALLTELFTRPQNWLEDPALVERCQPHQAVG